MADDREEPQVHPMAFRTEEIDILVAEHRVLWDDIKPLVETIAKDVKLIVTELYGEHRPTAADPDARQGGVVEVLTIISNDVVAMRHAAENGGIRAKRAWGIGEWTVAGSFIALCVTAIFGIMALISSVVGG